MRNFSRDLENIRNFKWQILQLKNKITEIKNSAEEQVRPHCKRSCEPEHRSRENIDATKEKSMGSTEKTIRNMDHGENV